MLNQIQVIIIKGGIMMIPLGVCSFIVVLIVIERLFMLRPSRLVSRLKCQQWISCLSFEIGQEDIEGNPSSSILTQVLSPLIGYLPLERAVLEERLSDLARQQRHKLERGLVYLDTIAGIAPLFGLLGTALGMVEVFSRLSMMGETKMGALSAGISQALFTTVAGLSIGIPALIAFNLFTRHIDSIMIRVEEHLNLVIDQCSKNMIK